MSRIKVKDVVQCRIVREITYTTEADCKKKLKVFESLIKNPAISLSITFIKQ